MNKLLEIQDLESRTVPDLISRSAHLFGRDRRFYYDLLTGRELSFGEFQERIASTASWLAREFEKGDVIGVALSNRLEYFVLRYAISTAGLVEAAFNGTHKGVVLKRLVEIAQPEAIFIEDSMASNFQACGYDFTGVRLFNESDLVTATSSTIGWNQRPHRDIDPGDPCRIVFTSGTSGGSKGAELSHAYEVFSGYGYSRWLGLETTDRWLFVTPFFHIDAICVVSTALHHGGSFALAPRFSASRFWKQAQQAGTTTFLYVGTILAILLKGEDPPPGGTMRCAIGGGCPGPLWELFEERFGLPVIELFGMTECISATINRYDNRRIGSVGQVLDGYEIAVVDSFDRPLPPGKKGEIVIRGREPFSLMNGYRGDPASTQKCIRNFWFHTGDRGSFDEDGFMYYHGRIKDIIRVCGENVDASELETIVDSLPGVRYCAAIGVPSDVTDEDILLYIQAQPDTTVEPEKIVDLLGEQVAPFMLPRYIRVTGHLPLTPTEKVIKTNLLAAVDSSTWVRP